MRPLRQKGIPPLMRLIDPRLLRDWMTKRDMTGARLGRATGLSRQFVSQLTTGYRRSCSDERAFKIETALDVPTGTLFRDDDDGQLAAAGSGRSPGGTDRAVA